MPDKRYRRKVSVTRTTIACKKDKQFDYQQWLMTRYVLTETSLKFCIGVKRSWKIQRQNSYKKWRRLMSFGVYLQRYGSGYFPIFLFVALRSFLRSRYRKRETVQFNLTQNQICHEPNPPNATLWLCYDFSRILNLNFSIDVILLICMACCKSTHQHHCSIRHLQWTFAETKFFSRNSQFIAIFYTEEETVNYLHYILGNLLIMYLLESETTYQTCTFHVLITLK